MEREKKKLEKKRQGTQNSQRGISITVDRSVVYKQLRGGHSPENAQSILNMPLAGGKVSMAARTALRQAICHFF